MESVTQGNMPREEIRGQPPSLKIRVLLSLMSSLMPSELFALVSTMSLFFLPVFVNIVVTSVTYDLIP